MLRAALCCTLLLLAVPHSGQGHAPPTLAPTGPLHAERNRLVDSAGRIFLLRGVQVNASVPAFAFRILRQRWNMNAVRLPVSRTLWERDGEVYLRATADIVRAANQENLVVVIGAFDETGAGLPNVGFQNFWRAWAGFFKDNPLVIFDIFNEPRPANQHSASDWQSWRNSMQPVVDAIRGAGATQLIAVQGFHDTLGFRGIGPEHYIDDPNIIYEVHPYYDQAATDDDRLANFGFLSTRFPVYAGEWGLPFSANTPACRAIPRDTQKATEILFQTVAYFDLRDISWTVTGFEPSGLITDFTSYAPTVLDRLWTCGETQNPQPGMGQFLLLWMTGDPGGFGYLGPDQIANAAGGPAGPIAPGEVVTLYGQGFGPEVTVSGRFDATGTLETLVGETRVLFDGIPAPIFSTEMFQVTVQVPYEVAGKQSVTVQAFYRDVPSNTISVGVADSSPELFRVSSSNDVIAINQDGAQNAGTSPAAQGSIVSMFATGSGQTTPAGITGKPAGDPYPQSALAPSVFIGGQSAEVLYVGMAPGMVGVLQINVRVPVFALGESTRTPVILTIGGRSNQRAVAVWVK